MVFILIIINPFKLEQGMFSSRTQNTKWQCNMDAPSPLCQVSSHQTKELVTRVTCDEEHVTESTGTQTLISPSVQRLSAAARRCWTPSTRPPSCPRHPRPCCSERVRPRPRERERRGDHWHWGQVRGERSPSLRGPRHNCCSGDLRNEKVF